MIALSVRRKWERKFGLFIALPVASDLESAMSGSDNLSFCAAYDTVSDVVESNGQFASKIMTPNRMH